MVEYKLDRLTAIIYSLTLKFQMILLMMNLIILKQLNSLNINSLTNLILMKMIVSLNNSSHSSRTLSSLVNNKITICNSSSKGS